LTGMKNERNAASGYYRQTLIKKFYTDEIT